MDSYVSGHWDMHWWKKERKKEPKNILEAHNHSPKIGRDRPQEGTETVHEDIRGREEEKNECLIHYKP